MFLVIRNLCHGSGGQSPASRLGGQGSILDQSVWDLGWARWYWDEFFSELFCFILLVSFHQCSVLVLLSTTDATYSQQLKVPLNNALKGQSERYTQLVLMTLPVELTSVVFGRVSYSCLSEYYHNGHRISSLDTDLCI